MADLEFYDGGVFNRSVRPDNTTRRDVEIQVIQFQSDPARRGDLRPPIPLERTNLTGIRHEAGVLSMARSGPDTATSSFFITIGEQPELDFGGKRNADGQGFGAFRARKPLAFSTPRADTSRGRDSPRWPWL